LSFCWWVFTAIFVDSEVAKQKYEFEKAKAEQECLMIERRREDRATNNIGEFF
jgi:hypothetical protein